MTWQRFWEISEQGFDRLYTVALTIMILDTLNGVPFHLKAIVACTVIAMVGGLFCALFAAACEPEDQDSVCAIGCGCPSDPWRKPSTQQ